MFTSYVRCRGARDGKGEAACTVQYNCIADVISQHGSTALRVYTGHGLKNSSVQEAIEEGKEFLTFETEGKYSLV